MLTFNNNKNKIMFFCDGCRKPLVFVGIEFNVAISKYKKYKWRMWEDKGKWYNCCPSCKLKRI